MKYKDQRIRKMMIGHKALVFAHATDMSYGDAVRAIEYILSKGRRLSSISLDDITHIKPESKGE
jgi:hypothetical protein